jgi:predicted Zn-dependent protease
MRRGWLAAFVVAALLQVVHAAVLADSAELHVGQQVLQQYDRQGLVLRGTRYNAILLPIGQKLAAAGGSLYDEPFKFVVLRGKMPNAFSAPGGYVFVTNSLIDLIKTKDELACVGGHEMAHIINHDVMNRLKRTQQTGIWLTIGQLLLGGGVAQTASIALSLQSLHFDRAVETGADIRGAELCAKAGYNPYALVWLMQKFESLPNQMRTMEMFSDHPREDHRISDLEAHFKAQPEAFGKFSPDQTTAQTI